MPFLRKAFGEFVSACELESACGRSGKVAALRGFVSRLSVTMPIIPITRDSIRTVRTAAGSGRDGQRVMYGFSPLLGQNFYLQGTLEGSLWGEPPVQLHDVVRPDHIVRAISWRPCSQEMAITASYSRRGFEIPFFGLSLNTTWMSVFHIPSPRTPGRRTMFQNWMSVSRVPARRDNAYRDRATHQVCPQSSRERLGVLTGTRRSRRMIPVSHSGASKRMKRTGHTHFDSVGEHGEGLMS